MTKRGKESYTLQGKSKPEAFELLFGNEEYLLVHLDSTTSGVELPSHLMGQPSVTLKLSQYFRGATEREPDAIIAYLKFTGEYAKCVIPWSAIWGMSYGEEKKAIWAADLPKEILVEAAKTKIAELGEKVLGVKPKLAEVKSETKGSPSSEISSAKPKPALRRIK